MAETITPEQRAELALSEGWGMSRQFQVRAIADAIRAAVEAERDRCAHLARQSDKGQDLTGDELADMILAPEADRPQATASTWAYSAICAAKSRTPTPSGRSAK